MLPGIKELLVTADNPWKGSRGTIRSMFLMTGNFDKDVKKNLDALEALQPKRPKMTMEFWGGWYDHWGKKRSTKTLEEFRTTYEEILSYPASVNVYIFVGGTNYGFLNGAENSKHDDEDSGKKNQSTS